MTVRETRLPREGWVAPPGHLFAVDLGSAAAVSRKRGPKYDPEGEQVAAVCPFHKKHLSCAVSHLNPHLVESPKSGHR